MYHRGGGGTPLFTIQGKQIKPGYGSGTPAFTTNSTEVMALAAAVLK